MNIRLLNQTLINQIAAGEVIERPASAIKELVENAIDAGATTVQVFIREGGKTYFSVTDDGGGMSKEDLDLSVERHATSKIPDEDLFNIQTFGFRGEALASIGAVSRLKLTSKEKTQEQAWSLEVEGGVKGALMPSTLQQGTKIEVRDLFFATPVRLKFLKSTLSETQQIKEIITSLSLAHTHVTFTLVDDTKPILSLTSPDRLKDVFGQEVLANALTIQEGGVPFQLQGIVTLPTFQKSTSMQQYFFINNRPIKDKVLQMALKIAYMDVIPKDRYPVACLYLTLPPYEVDVNVHPAKTEVRFKDPQAIKSFIISSVRKALYEQVPKTSSHLGEKTLNAFEVEKNASNSPLLASLKEHRPSSREGAFVRTTEGFSKSPYFSQLPTPKYALQEEYDCSLRDESFDAQISLQNDQKQDEKETLFENELDLPLGYAKAQLHGTYIISQTAKGLVLVDQHAAHERITYEKLKCQVKESGLSCQNLLLPEMIELPAQLVPFDASCLTALEKFGFYGEQFGVNSILITKVPVLLGQENPKHLILDVLEEFHVHETMTGLEEKILHKLATWSCHHSVRAGQKLSIEEMNALLREIEKTPLSSQCNHGRPTFIDLSLKDLERLFERA